jgi:inorganic pyrophosphatase
MGLFTLPKVLPAGVVFPYDFGFIPATLEADGDPLDALVPMDQTAFTGCVAVVRLLGVIEAEQTEHGKTVRNDRLLAAAVVSHQYEGITALQEMSLQMLDEIEHFFQSYAQVEGKQFKTLGRDWPERGARRVAAGIQQLKDKKKNN